MENISIRKLYNSWLMQLKIVVLSTVVISFAYGMTPNDQLFKAVINKDRAAVEQALNNNADVNAQNRLEDSPLIAILLKALSENIPGNIPQVLDIVRLLLERGANVNFKNMSGATPLHIAATIKDPVVTRLLLEKGADVNAKNNIGQTPLYFARSPEVAQLLVERGADVNAKDSMGQTPLIAAISMRKNIDLDLVRMLLDLGADVKIQDTHGKTALSYSDQLKNRELVKLLAQAAKKSQERYVERLQSQLNRNK